MYKLPPLRELRAFESAARHLSFRGAAAELSVTPTAISHQIRLLELYCARPLFSRRPLALTEAGQRLFPVASGAFAALTETLESIRTDQVRVLLRLTATNAFSALWLVPRVASLQRACPDIGLDILGTNRMLSLAGGEADVAIRYARMPPVDGQWLELLRDEFYFVGQPSYLGGGPRLLDPAGITARPIVEIGWTARDRAAPSLERWSSAAAQIRPDLPRPVLRPAIRFEEELHAIEAIIAGQGIGLCSTVLVAKELAEGTLVRLSELGLPGYGFYMVWRRDHPQQRDIGRLADWLRGESAPPSPRQPR